MKSNTISTTTSAPGSVFISGEYLILLDEPALVSAVDRKASACFKLESTGYEVKGISNSDQRLPNAVCEVLNIPRVELDHVQTSVEQLVSERGDKFGLSSSAASCVALVRLLSPGLSDLEVSKFAGKAHRIFQKGKGSNADVQLASYGGSAVVYQQKDGNKEIEKVNLPPSLRCEVVWMSAPAKTVSFITKFNHAFEDPLSDQEILERMKVNNRVIISCVRSNAASDFLLALKKQDDLLNELGKKIGAPIHVAAHTHLKKICGSEFVAKVSGSGGGDISLIFGEKDADWQALLSSLPDEIVYLELQLEQKS